MKSTRKNFSVLPIGLRTFVLATAAFTAVSCSDDKKGGSEYDPNLPVKIGELNPATGGYFDKVILQGENFGNDPKRVRVFFNKKEAIVVGASGDRVLVHVPKLPGEDCKIGMLLNGNTKDTIFSEKRFEYVKNFQLQYVAGQLNSNTNYFDEGDLQTTVFGNGMQYLACDPQGIIYMNHKGENCNGSLVYINEPENFTKFLVCGSQNNVGGAPQAPVYDKETGMVYYCAHNAPYFWQVDPSDSWSFTKKQLLAPNEVYQEKGYRPLPSGRKLEYMYSFAYCEDGFLYCRAYNSTFFRFKLSDRVYDVVAESCPTGAADAYLCTDPDDPTKIYCSLAQFNIITCIDITKDPVTDPDNFEKIVCGIKGTGDYQDGHVGIARLNSPQQILPMRDPETNEKVIYICDMNNNCVRQFNVDTQIMKTVAGIGKKAGYATGSPEVSKMNKPVGICITPENDIYVADAGNKVIMKIAFL